MITITRESAHQLLFQYFMKVVLTYGIILFMLCDIVLAQQPDSAHVLRGVTISEKILPQNKIRNIIDSVLSISYSSSTLSDWLIRNSAVHIRQYASGTLATIHSLGFGASQHQVVWNGLLLNNSMNGVQDLNLLPMWFLQSNEEDTDLNYMNTGSNYRIRPDITDKNNVSVFSQLTSSQNSVAGIKLNTKNTKRAWNVCGLITNQKNKIPFFNINEGKKAVLTHAAASLQGVQAYYKHALNKRLSIEPALWYVSAKRQIPPSMLQLISRSVEMDEQFRTTLRLQWSHQMHQLEWMNAYSYDVIRYHDSTITLYAHNQSQMRQSQLQWQYSPTRWFRQSAGIRYQLTQARTDRYQGLVHQERWFLQWAPQVILFKKHILLSTVNTLERVTSTSPQWSSRGLVQIRYTKHWFSAHEMGRTYRIPTLNDLYWIPGGNTGLLPETSVKYESSIRYSTSNKFSAEIESKGFYYKSTNLIVWRPSGMIWTPMNLRASVSYGLINQLQLSYRHKKYAVLQECTYTFNITRVTATYDDTDNSLNKPVPYAPRHRLYSTTIAVFNTHRFIWQQEWVSRRYSSFDAANSLRAYYVTDIEYRKRISRHRHVLDIGFKVNNALNTSYQTIIWQPMPGRYCSLQLYYSFSETKQPLTNK